MRTSPRKQKSKISVTSKKNSASPQQSKSSNKRKGESQINLGDSNKKNKSSKQGSNNKQAKKNNIIGTSKDKEQMDVENSKVK